MKEIHLTQGLSTIVDDEDYPLLSRFKWYAAKHRRTYYALRTEYLGGQKKTIRMHRLILSAKEGQDIDHENGNGLDNRKQNLRFCTPMQNAQNRRLEGKGVRRRTDRPNGSKSWTARITVDRKTKSLGCFATKEEAETAYQYASKELFGEFAP